ncbi:hypothetical protein [Magnetovibrio sp.]|uniref:hypothetical protein n=1 Tax=Magnetovibrio sp. TaxID=2024836 RepID=UPI002F9432C7
MINGERRGPNALFHGDVSLTKAFWLWGALGGGGQIALFSALLLALPDAPSNHIGWALLGWIGFLYLYFTIVFVGIWRSAGRVLTLAEGKSFAVAARVMVGLGVVLSVSITVQVLFMGGSPH